MPCRASARGSMPGPFRSVRAVAGGSVRGAVALRHLPGPHLRAAGTGIGAEEAGSEPADLLGRAEGERFGGEAPGLGGVELPDRLLDPCDLAGPCGHLADAEADE